MFAITETSNFDATVSGNDTTDAVLGGPAGPQNAGLTNLTNRSRWLYNQIVGLLGASAPINSPAFTGTPTAPTAATGDNSTKIATTSFVQTAVDGIATVSITGSTNTVLTAAQYGCGIIILTGIAGSGAIVVFPNTGRWLVVNRTTGIGSILTLKTAAGTGYNISPLKSLDVWSDGTNLYPDLTDLASIGLVTRRVSGAYTPVQADGGTTFICSAAAAYTLDPTQVMSGWVATFSMPANIGGSMSLTAINGAALDGVAARAGMGGSSVKIYFDGVNFSTVSGPYVWNQVITGWTNGSVQGAYAHALGTISRRLVTLTAVCATAEHSYAVGDNVVIESTMNAANQGCSIRSNNTNASIVIGTGGLPAADAGTETTFAITPANWNLSLTIESR